ncbi:MAG: glycosyltransferase family 39 protein [Pyrinomonadaceae bacterium]
MFNKKYTRVLLFLPGVAMLVFAVVVSSDSYARFLLGENAKDLAWGPALFRVLLAFHGALLITVSLVWERFSSTKKNAHESSPKERMSAAIWIALAFLCVVSLGLRMWYLNTDLWVDELLTLLDFSRQPMGQILTSFPNQNQHMLFSILSHASIETFGESAWALRLPSVLFGVASVFVFFFFCRRFVSVRESLLSCALMTVSYHHIWFSQNARGYMGLLLFTLLATWCWFEALENNKWRWWLGYVMSVVLGMWIHSTMAFVVASQGLLYLTLLAFPGLGGQRTEDSPERRAGLRPWAAWAISITATMQLYALALPEFLAVGLHEESKDSEWTNIFWVLSESLRGLSFGFAGLAVVLGGGVFVAFGWLSLFKRSRRLAVLMVLPAILAGTTMLLLGHNLWPRFFFFSMGFGLLIIVHGATELPAFLASFVASLKDRPQITALAGVALTVLIILASLFSAQRNYALPKQDFSGAKNYIESQSLPGDRVIVVSLASLFYNRYMALPWQVAKSRSDLEDFQGTSDRTWLIYTLPIEVKAFRPDLWQVIERDYNVEKVFPGTLHGGEIFVCQRRMIKEESE